MFCRAMFQTKYIGIGKGVVPCRSYISDRWKHSSLDSDESFEGGKSGLTYEVFIALLSIFKNLIYCHRYIGPVSE